MIDRKIGVAVILTIITLCVLCFGSQALFSDEDDEISVEEVEHAQELIDLDFDPTRIDTMRSYLDRNRSGYDSLRAYDLPFETLPALVFDHHPDGYELPEIDNSFNIAELSEFTRPDNDADIAYCTIPQLAHLLRSKQLSSTELTKIYLRRLKEYNPILECAISITEKLAMDQAAKADEELAQGIDRGLLHGIPYGTKDLMAVEGYKTTWGAMPYKDQKLNYTATVIQKLSDAGAVLVAKLTTGALARGDVWFDGETKNPWDTLHGASGSSAGPGSATAAGLVAFSLGTETLGSITSPSNRNGITGLRPSYGRVSRHGVMSLSWSMDKVGPMCRSAEDCSIVFEAIRGKDSLDVTTQEVGFNYSSSQTDISTLKVAYLKDLIESDTSDAKENLDRAMLILDSMGIRPTPISLPEEYPYAAFDIILRAEAGAMFDDIVRSGEVDEMVQQSKRSRANSLRQSRFIPAVEYLQANRFRRLLINEINDLFEDYDVIISPTFGGRQLLITNLTGHPVVTVPTGLDDDGHPTSITFVGNLYQEAAILSFAQAYQSMTDYDEIRPPLFSD